MEASILQKCDDVIKRTHVSEAGGYRIERALMDCVAPPPLDERSLMDFAAFL